MGDTTDVKTEEVDESVIGMSDADAGVPELTDEDPGVQPVVPPEAGETGPTDGPGEAAEGPDLQLTQAEMLRIERDVIICYQDAEGNVLEEVRHTRSLYGILVTLAAGLEEDPETAELKVDLYLRIPAAEEGGEVKKLTIFTGTRVAACEFLGSKVVRPEVAAMQLQSVPVQMAEVTNLKGIFVTAVFDDAKPMSFSFISESSKVTDADIKVLATYGRAKLNEFRDTISKAKGITFPDDSNIIMPGSR